MVRHLCDGLLVDHHGLNGWTRDGSGTRQGGNAAPLAFVLDRHRE